VEEKMRRKNAVRRRAAGQKRAFKKRELGVENRGREKDANNFEKFSGYYPRFYLR
jgi:hypothetical protein